MNKIKNLDFLRILFTLIIVMYHLFSINYLYGIAPSLRIFRHLHNSMVDADKCVDFFFILSGFLLALTFNSNFSTFDFAKKRLLRLYPAVFICILAYLITSFLGIGHFYLFENILTLLTINGIGLTFTIGNSGQLWFVSALLWSSIFYFYIIKNFDRNYVNLFIVIITFFSYSLELHYGNGHLHSSLENIYLVFNTGLLRAFGGLGIGYFVHIWYLQYSREESTNPNLLQMILITGLEVYLSSFLILHLVINPINYENDFIFILYFAVLICLFLIHKSFISQYLNSNLFIIIGKYAYTIFVMHFLIFNFLNKALWIPHKHFVYAHPYLNIFIAIFSVFIISIVIYHFLENPIRKFLNKRLIKFNDFN